MSVCVYSVFVLSFVQVAAFRRADPSSKESYRLCIGLRNWKNGQGPTRGCRAIDRQIYDSGGFQIVTISLLFRLSIYTEMLYHSQNLCIVEWEVRYVWFDSDRHGEGGKYNLMWHERFLTNILFESNHANEWLANYFVTRSQRNYLEMCRFMRTHRFGSL
jgi:hypothetical protein